MITIVIFYFPQLMREEINQKYNGLILGLDKNDPTYEARKESYQSKREEDLDSIDSLEARLKKKTEKKEISRYRR